MTVSHRLLNALMCAALIACGGSDATTSTHVESSAPRIDQFSVSPSNAIEPGTQITVSYSISDDIGVHRSTITLSGAATLEREQNEGDVRAVSRSVNIVVPSNARLDGQLRVGLQVFNTSGKSAQTQSPSMTMGDNSAPHISGALLTPNGVEATTVGEMATAVGDSVRILVIATDNHKLAWVGWRLGAPANRADSVAVSGTQERDTARMTAADAWIGTSSLTLFARDSVGHLAEVRPTVDRLMVYPSRAVTLRRAAVGRMVLDYAYDDVHDRLIVLLTDSTTIYTVPLGTFTPDAPVHLPEQAGGLDVTASGDSLVIALPGSAALGLLPIGAPVSALARVPISFDASIGPGPERVKIASNGKALISLAALTGTAPYRFITLDMRTGAQQKRTDVGPLGSGGGTLLVRSFDRQRILAIYGGGCCYGAGLFYEVGRDGFFASPALEQLGPGEPTTADSSGSGFLIGSRYVGGDLFTPSTIQAPRYSDFYYNPTAIAPDGTLGYFSRGGDGYTTVRLSDRQVVEAVIFAPNDPTFAPYRLIALPGGRMSGWSTSTGELFLVSPR